MHPLDNNVLIVIDARYKHEEGTACLIKTHIARVSLLESVFNFRRGQLFLLFPVVLVFSESCLTVAARVTNALREDNKLSRLICALDSLLCYMIFKAYLIRNLFIRHFGSSLRS